MTYIHSGCTFSFKGYIFVNGYEEYKTTIAQQGSLFLTMKALLCLCIIVSFLGIGATIPPVETELDEKISVPPQSEVEGNRKQLFSG